MTVKECFHCHEPIPENVTIFAKVQGSEQEVCCYGCKAVAEFLDEQGYCEFYDYRGDSLPSSKAKIAEEKWKQYDDSVNFQIYTQFLSDSRYIVSIFLEGIYCSACGWLIDKHLKSLDGIYDVKLNTVTKMLQVEFDTGTIQLSQILSEINRLGYLPVLNKDKNTEQQSIKERKASLKRLLVSGLGMMFIMTLAVPIYGSEYSEMDKTIYRFFMLTSMLVATAVYFYSGRTFLQNAYRDLSNKHLGMDVPVALSITLAYGASCWNVLTDNGATIYFDSMVMFIFFLLAGRFVEMTVRHQGMDANEALGSMIPVSVKKIANSEEVQVPLDTIAKGDIIRVNEGEIVPVDGEIIEGEGKVDESMLTGESIPVIKTLGESLMAGSRITTGLIDIRSTAIGNDTVLAGLSGMLESAQLQKPKTFQVVDKIAGWFVATVLLLAAITAIYYSFYDADRTLIIVLSVLVATCPCALSLATPVALTAASVRLMKHGILIKNLDVITKTSKIRNWFFDKTGTLTEPYMSVLQIHNYSDMSDSDIFRIMASLEHKSSHPIASAFTDFFDNSIIVSELKETSGSGIEAMISGNIYKAGSKKWCGVTEKENIKSRNILMYLTKNSKLLAIFELNNKLRKGSKEQILQLKNNGNLISVISGDKKESVENIAKQISVEKYYFEQTPEEKINKIHTNQQQGIQTVMVGDGVNDAPVLAQADVSISFNQGTQLARAASDMIIMGSSLENIGILNEVSKKANRIIHQNIIWALIYNLSVTPLAIMGYLAPWMAAIGMSVSSLFVVLNAKRILIGRFNK